MKRSALLLIFLFVSNFLYAVNILGGYISSVQENSDSYSIHRYSHEIHMVLYWERAAGHPDLTNGFIIVNGEAVSIGVTGANGHKTHADNSLIASNEFVFYHSISNTEKAVVSFYLDNAIHNLNNSSNESLYLESTFNINQPFLNNNFPDLKLVSPHNFSYGKGRRQEKLLPVYERDKDQITIFNTRPKVDIHSQLKDYTDFSDLKWTDNTVDNGQVIGKKYIIGAPKVEGDYLLNFLVREEKDGVFLSEINVVVVASVKDVDLGINPEFWTENPIVSEVVTIPNQVSFLEAFKADTLINNQHVFSDVSHWQVYEKSWVYDFDFDAYLESRDYVNLLSSGYNPEYFEARPHTAFGLVKGVDPQSRITFYKEVTIKYVLSLVNQFWGTIDNRVPTCLWTTKTELPIIFGDVYWEVWRKKYNQIEDESPGEVLLDSLKGYERVARLFSNVDHFRDTTLVNEREYKYVAYRNVLVNSEGTPITVASSRFDIDLNPDLTVVANDVITNNPVLISGQNPNSGKWFIHEDLRVLSIFDMVSGEIIRTYKNVKVGTVLNLEVPRGAFLLLSAEAYNGQFFRNKYLIQE